MSGDHTPAVSVPGSVYGFTPEGEPATPQAGAESVQAPAWMDEPTTPRTGGSMTTVYATDGLIAIVAIAATVAAVFSVAGFTSQDLMAVYLYVLGYATGRPVPTTAVKPPGA